MKRFKLQILTPKHEFYNEEVESISINTISGRIQILANHIPYVSGVISSGIKIKNRDGEKYGFVSDGLLSFSNNNALIFVDTAEWTERKEEP
jgi:F-type H+-transporting ATPase subunit epsilon